MLQFFEYFIDFETSFFFFLFLFQFFTMEIYRSRMFLTNKMARLSSRIAQFYICQGWWTKTRPFLDSWPCLIVLSLLTRDLIKDERIPNLMKLLNLDRGSVDSAKCLCRRAKSFLSSRTNPKYANEIVSIIKKIDLSMERDESEGSWSDELWWPRKNLTSRDWKE